MSELILLSTLKQAIYTTMLIAAPFLIVSVVVGLIISIFQATTQIQEQTLTFVPKLLAVAAVGILLSAWIMHTMDDFTISIFKMIANITR
ncbi:MAG: flagellar biosynthesis protein FliQ [Clostridium sp.]|nr:flagellar biosynthesis protein FliQ [Clostridium sp.]